MSALSPTAIAALRDRLRGAVIAPTDPAYETARRVWNGLIDRRPALIVRCTGTADVLAALAFAREQGLPVALRGGGHNVAGNAVCDDGLALDLSPMKGLWVDPAARTALAQPGLTWGEFDRETQVFGLATTGGLVSTTGIAGLTLGGGIGWLMRRHGLTCDNLRAVQLVTAAGQVVRASPHENADLFWAVRGAGHNFGAVVALEYQLHPVGPMVLGGPVLYRAAQAAEVLAFFRDWTRTAPDDLTAMVVFLTAPPAPFIPPALHGQPMVAIAVCYSGPLAEGEKVLVPLRAFGPPAVDLIGPLPYTALQSLFDHAAPAGLANYWKSGYLPQLSDQALAVIGAHSAALPTPLSQVHLHHLEGAVSRVPAEATAFAHRTAGYALNIIATWTAPEEAEAARGWVRRFWEAIQPFTDGVYVNFLGADEPERVRAAYGPHYERLVALKTRYDPDNMFRFNQNIRPRPGA